jgi:hypothetical protein
MLTQKTFCSEASGRGVTEHTVWTSEIQSNLVNSPLVSSPNSPLAKLSLGGDFHPILGASFRYLVTSPVANISGWTNGGELTRFDCTVTKKLSRWRANCCRCVERRLQKQCKARRWDVHQVSNWWWDSFFTNVCSRSGKLTCPKLAACFQTYIVS